MTQKQKIYDFIIIWWWAAGLYASIFAPRDYDKIILEKNSNPWVKVLLSWGERANLTNIDIEPERDYFGQNKKAMISILKRFSNYDTISYFSEDWLSIIEEDRGRMILESWNSRELLDILLKKSKENNNEIMNQIEVKNITKEWEIFEIDTSDWLFQAKKVLVCVWGKSFSHVGTRWDWYNWAERLDHHIYTPYPTLCWIVTRKDLSEISGISTNLRLELLDKTKNKIIYNEFWPILFTHFGLSWPIIFNTSSAIWEYINSFKNDIIDFENFIRENISIRLIFTENTPKRVKKFFDIRDEEQEIILDLQNLRSFKEAKATGWWISLYDLTNNLESKKVPWLYFAGEILDLTGKTWWYNLQLAWSTGYIVGNSI